MKIVSSEQMRNIDKLAITDYKVSELVLMENAGRSVAEEILKNFSTDYRIGVIAGAGNNAGDGFVCARHLFINQYSVIIFLAGRKEKRTSAAEINYSIAQRMGIKIFDISDLENFEKNKRLINNCDIIIDALLGTGINSPLRTPLAEIVVYLNSLKKYTVAVDIPTGIFSDDPNVILPVLKADKTVTFGLPKISHILSPARKYVGELKVVNIGFPEKLLQNEKIKLNLITERLVQDFLPARPLDAHKGDFGHIMFFAGSTGKTGAAIMASKSALKAGAGMVTTVCPQEINSVLETAMIEVMTLPVNLNNTEDALKKIHSLAERVEIISVGCGITTEIRVKNFLKRLLEYENKIFVLDADALNIIAQEPGILKNKKSKFVLTPHIGEMARLAGKDNQDILKNRIEIAKNYATENECIVVLKSAETVIASPEEQVYICNSGNEGMATAGSGDVLTGIISGFLAQNVKQGKSIISSVVLGVYIHSIAGNIAHKLKGSYSLIATDILENIPEAIKCIRQKIPQEK